MGSLSLPSWGANPLGLGKSTLHVGFEPLLSHLSPNPMLSSPQAVLSPCQSCYLTSLSKEPSTELWTTFFSYWFTETFWGFGKSTFPALSKLQKCHVLSRYSAQQPVETREDKNLAWKWASVMFCSRHVRNTRLLTELWQRQKTVLQTAVILTLHKFGSCSGNCGLGGLPSLHRMCE